MKTVTKFTELSGPMLGFAEALEDVELPAALTDSRGRLLLSNDQMIALLAQLENPKSDDNNLCELLSAAPRASEAVRIKAQLDTAINKCNDSIVPQILAVSCGEKLSLSISISPQVCDSSDRYLLWVLRDVGIDSRLEERDQHLQKMQTITRFAGGMAHEFNNLLTAILGNFELIRVRPEARVEQVAANLESAEVAALRASQLIQELRRFASREVPSREVLSVCRIIRQTRKILAGSISKNIVVTQEFEDNSQLNALINSGQLQEVLLKLGMNASEAIGSSAGRIHFAVAATEDEAGDPVIRIDVTDSGHGMNQQTRERAFEPLFTTRDDTRAAGLGMSIAHGLIEEMGGRIRISDSSEFGSVVSVTLPQVFSDSSHNDESGVRSSSVVLKIGTLDNERSVRKVVLGMLSILGHNAETFADGSELISAFENGQTFDVLLIDHVMPRMTGRETYRRIRQLDTEVKVVISSGQQLDVEQFCSECQQQPDAFLKKPFTMEELNSLLESLT